MKTIYLLALLVNANMLCAQCTPNTLYNDSAVGLYPKDTIWPCHNYNQQYERVLTYKSPDSISFFGTKYEVDSVIFSLENFTSGMNLASFPNLVNGGILACLRIYGQYPNQTNYNSEDNRIRAKIYYGGFGTFQSVILGSYDFSINNTCNQTTNISNVVKSNTLKSTVVNAGHTIQIKKATFIYNTSGMLLKKLQANSTYTFNQKGHFIMVEQNKKINAPHKIIVM